jgi:uncharacterized protein (DUF1015 family)
MADVQPLRALHYDLAKTSGLRSVIAPPYDVIDEREREQLESRSPYNVVRIDLPRGDGDAYEHAAVLFDDWQRERVVVGDPEPAVWPLKQDYTGPDGLRRTRTGLLARVRVDEYGPGRIRPHERTHPGPKEDRLRLTRATQANLSPILSLYDDPDGVVGSALGQLEQQQPVGEAVDDDGTLNRLWRITDPSTIETIAKALAGTELLIADGHHRYETARLYAEEIGGEGPQRYVLMCLVAMQDPGLTVFPTHRLVRGLTQAQRAALARTLQDDFQSEPLQSPDALEPTANGSVRIGYFEGGSREPAMLTLRDQSIADAALQGHAEPYRRLDTAVLEALVLKRALGLDDDQIDHLEGLGYALGANQALGLVERGDYDAAFFMAPVPVARVRAIASAGESMPPKSTYFFPKVPTGLVFNPLSK